MTVTGTWAHTETQIHTQAQKPTNMQTPLSPSPSGQDPAQRDGPTFSESFQGHVTGSPPPLRVAHKAPGGCPSTSAFSPVPHLHTPCFLRPPSLCTGQPSAPPLSCSTSHILGPHSWPLPGPGQILLSLTGLPCLCDPVTVACPPIVVHERAATSGWLTTAPSQHPPMNK